MNRLVYRVARIGFQLLVGTYVIKHDHLSLNKILVFGVIDHETFGTQTNTVELKM